MAEPAGTITQPEDRAGTVNSPMATDAAVDQAVNDKEAPAIGRAAARQLKPLTSLRFFAAAMIVFFHSRGQFGITRNWDSLSQGVSFFFVLSGFILTYVYPSLNSRAQVHRFWVARFARIWPAHITAIALVMLLLPSQAWNPFMLHRPWLAGAADVFMLQAWIPYMAYFFSLNAPSWSISVEASFYLFFPFLIQKLEGTWWRKLLLAVGALVAILVLCKWQHLPIILPPYTQTSVTGTALTYINPLGRMFEFVLGMCLCRFWKRHQNVSLGRAMATVLEIGCVGLIVVGLYLVRNHPTGLDAFLGPAGAEYLLHSGCAPLFGILICLMAWDRGWLSRILHGAGWVLLGEVSYSIYLTHQIFLRWYVARSPFPIPNWLQYAIFWVVVILVSATIRVLIERPSRRALVSGWDRRTPPRRSRSVATG